MQSVAMSTITASEMLIYASCLGVNVKNIRTHDNIIRYFPNELLNFLIKFFIFVFKLRNS
jgi:hypothetical protein